MIDLQKVVDAVSLSMKGERSRYHLTLGKLIEKLSESGVDQPVTFDRGGSPGEFGSYRGHYSDLYMEVEEAPVTSFDLLARAKAALGATYEGYKGGDFTMGKDTPLWRATYSHCGEAVIGIRNTDTSIELITKEID